MSIYLHLPIFFGCTCIYYWFIYSIIFTFMYISSNSLCTLVFYLCLFLLSEFLCFFYSLSLCIYLSLLLFRQLLLIFIIMNSLIYSLILCQSHSVASIGNWIRDDWFPCDWDWKRQRVGVSPPITPNRLCNRTPLHFPRQKRFSFRCLSLSWHLIRYVMSIPIHPRCPSIKDTLYPSPRPINLEVKWK